jgi:hypothetical protein
MLKKLLFLLLVIFSSQLFAAEMIYAWGYGDILEKTLNAVKFTFAHNDYAGIFKFALLMALIMALISSAQLGMKGDMLALPKLFAMSLGVSALFVTYKIDVVVKDVNTNQNYVIDQVPWAIAKPMSWFSGMEKRIGDIMETTFAVPGDISYSSGGFLSPFGIMDAAGEAKITDPNLFQSIDNFIIDCVTPDITTGYYDVTTLAHSEDLWAEFADTNPARVVYYYKTGEAPQIETCADAYTKINSDLVTYTSGTGMTSLGAMLGGYTGVQVAGILGTSSNYFMNYSRSAQSYLKQSIMINQFNDTYSNYSAANGMTGDSVAYGVGKGDQTAQANMVISGILGSKYIPVIKGILTVIITGLTPIVALMLLTPMFWKILSGYLLTMVWLALWHIGEVLLNFIILVKASSYMQVVTDSNGMYNMVSKPVVDGSFIAYVNMAGSMYWMIPSIAGLIVGGFSYMAMSGLAGAGKGSVDAGPRGAASEVAGGEAKLGNITMGNTRNNQEMYASNRTFGNANSMMNTFDSKSGFDGSSVNTSNTNEGLNVGGKHLTGNAKVNSDGNYKTLDSDFNYNYKDASGNLNTGTIKAGSKIDQNDNIILGSRIETSANGVTTTETYGGNGGGKYGNLLSQTIEGNGTKTTNTFHGGIATSFIEGANKSGSVSTIGNGEDAIITSASGTMGVKDSSGKIINNQRMQALETNVFDGLTHMLNGTKIKGSGIEIAASQIAAASKTNAKLKSQITSAGETAVATDSQAIATVGTTEESTQWSNMDKTETSNALTNTLTKLAAPALKKIGLSQDRLDKLGISGVFQMSDGTIVAQTDTGGKKFSLSNSAQSAYNKSTSTSYLESVANTKQEQNSMTNSRGKTAKSTDNTAMQAGLTAQHVATAARKLSESYVETIQKDSGLDSSGKKMAEFLNDYIAENKEQYSSQYGNGATGMRNAWAVQDKQLLDNFSQYALGRLGLAEEPKPIMNTVDENLLKKEGEKATEFVKKEKVLAKSKEAFVAAKAQDVPVAMKEAVTLLQSTPAIQPMGTSYVSGFGDMFNYANQTVTATHNKTATPKDKTIEELQIRTVKENGEVPKGQHIYDGNFGAAAGAAVTAVGTAFDYFQGKGEASVENADKAKVKPSSDVIPEGTKSLLKNASVVGTAAVIGESLYDAYKDVQNGDYARAGLNVINGGITLAGGGVGGIAGGIAGTFVAPGVGTTVGAVGGSAAGGYMASQFGQSLLDSYDNKNANEQRAYIDSMGVKPKQDLSKELDKVYTGKVENKAFEDPKLVEVPQPAPKNVVPAKHASIATNDTQPQKGTTGSGVYASIDSDTRSDVGTGSMTYNNLTQDENGKWVRTQSTSPKAPAVNPAPATATAPQPMKPAEASKPLETAQPVQVNANAQTVQQQAVSQEVQSLVKQMTPEMIKNVKDEVTTKSQKFDMSGGTKSLTEAIGKSEKRKDNPINNIPDRDGRA